MKHKRSIMSIAMASIMLVSLCAVCASTGVSAAPSSSTNVRPSAGLVGAPAGVVGAPAVCSQATNSLDLFVRGTDNALYWRHWTSATAWGLWMYLGGYLTSDPGATSDDGGVGYLAVFVRGGDGALWSRTMVNSGSSWSQWTSQGGQLLKGTGPAAAFFRDVWHGVFVTGTNHQLYYYNAASKVWQSLGGYLTSSPTATIIDCDPVCGCEVLARGGDGALWSIANYPSSWNAWHKIGGQLLEGTGPDNYGVSSPGYLVTGTDHALWWWTISGGWTSLGGYLTSSPAAVGRSYNVIDVFARGGDGNIWSRHTVNGGTSWDLWYKVAE